MNLDNLNGPGAGTALGFRPAAATRVPWRPMGTTDLDGILGKAFGPVLVPAARVPATDERTSADPSQLRNALIQMVMRYGDATQREGVCFTQGVFHGKPVEFWARARRRRFKAVQRLADALRDAAVSR